MAVNDKRHFKHLRCGKKSVAFISGAQRYHHNFDKLPTAPTAGSRTSFHMVLLATIVDVESLTMKSVPV
jgi:hypothetical protein